MAYDKTTHFRSHVDFKDPTIAQTKPIVPFQGLPVGIELFSRYIIQRNDFMAAGDLPATGTNWTITGTCTPALSDDTYPQYARFTEGAGTDNALVGLQWTDTGGAGEIFKLRSGKKLYFETAFRVGDTDGDAASVTQTEVFAGLCITDTTIIAGATDFIGFTKRDVTDDSTNMLYFVAGKNASTSGALVDQVKVATGLTLDAAGEAATVGGAEGGAIYRVAFLVDGTTNAYIWVGEGTYASGAMPALQYVGSNTDTTQMPDDEQLCLSFEVKNGEAQAKTLDLFYYLVAQER